MSVELQEICTSNNDSWPDNLDHEFEHVFRKWHPRALNGPEQETREPDFSSKPRRGRPPPPPPFIGGNPENADERGGGRDGSPPKLSPSARQATQMVDVDGGYLVGDPKLSQEIPTLAQDVFDANGVKVANLITIVPESSNSSFESAFIRQQWTTTLAIGIGAIIVALILVWALVRLLVAPIRKMKTNIGAMASGDYDQAALTVSGDELGDLMKNINFLSEVLSRNKQARQHMFADISHELRTPLSVLVAEIEAIKDGIRRFDYKQLSSIEVEVQRLRKLVDDLYQLSLSDIGGLSYDFKHCDLSPIVETAISQVSSLIGTDDVVIQSQLDSNIVCSLDVDRMGQLLSNLLNNSIAYTDTPGRLNISLRKSDDRALLIIEDTPPTVSAHALEDIFSTLHRRWLGFGN